MKLPAVTLLILATVTLAGCSRFAGGWEPVGQGPLAITPNPLPVPLFSRELVMDEVSDEVEDYFRILREQRIRLVGNILTEGYLDTEPRIGATLLEPWRADSTSGFERAHATLQTVRRWAKVRVIPAADSYLIDVKVFKELEDLEQPMQSTISGRALRHDSGIDFGGEARRWSVPNRGWIPMGRDYSLEQEILANLQTRFEKVAASGAPCARPQPGW